MRVGILTDYPSPSVLSGPAIHTRFLKENLTRRGHDVVLVGPTSDGHELPGNPGEHLFTGVPYPTHPKTRIVMPWPVSQLAQPPQVDVIHGQINTHMIHYGGWMRKMWRAPMLNTHILHLPTHSHFLVGDELYRRPWVREQLARTAYNVERSLAQLFNQGDGLIVQSRHMVDYWLERGVEVPIDVVGRPIDPRIFDAPPGEDPFPTAFRKGGRLLVVCRHDREKSLDELITIFDRHIAPADPEATLTLIGDGAEHANLLALAATTRHADRIHFTGEVPHEALVTWYDHADLFVYTSISETFGNVVNEALWCGVPCVAYDDHMGVAHQVHDEVNGFLVPHGRPDSEERFARATLTLLRDPQLRERMSVEARRISRENAHPDVVIDRFEHIYERAIRRCHDLIPVPLSEQSRAAQYAELARATASWGTGHGVILGVAAAATRSGFGRKAWYGPGEQGRVREASGLFEAIRGRFTDSDASRQAAE